MKIRKIAKACEGIVDNAVTEDSKTETPVVAHELGKHPYESPINLIYKAIRELADLADTADTAKDADKGIVDAKFAREAIANLSVVMFDLKSEAGYKA